jgi:hypothetical protein
MDANGGRGKRKTGGAKAEAWCEGFGNLSEGVGVRGCCEPGRLALRGKFCRRADGPRPQRVKTECEVRMARELSQDR